MNPLLPSFCFTQEETRLNKPKHTHHFRIVRSYTKYYPTFRYEMYRVADGVSNGSSRWSEKRGRSREVEVCKRCVAISLTHITLENVIKMFINSTDQILYLLVINPEQYRRCANDISRSPENRTWYSARVRKSKNFKNLSLDHTFASVSWEKAYFLMHFRLSFILKRPKTLMKTLHF